MITNSSNERKLMSTRREKMAKSYTGKVLKISWFVILASFIFSLLLVYSYTNHNNKKIVKKSLNSVMYSPVLDDEISTKNYEDQFDDEIERLPIKEKIMESSINEVIMNKNGVKEIHSIPIMDRNEFRSDPVSVSDSDIKRSMQETAMQKAETEKYCAGKYIYIHQLPRKFNDDLIKHCELLSRWTDMCTFVSNRGLGPRLSNKEKVFSYTGWFATNQFSLEVIFHNRMKQYKCLTTNSSQASAIFVPFYAGLDVARYLWDYNTTMRDSATVELLRWLRLKPEWKKMMGHDHFLVAGRISWDFRRFHNQDSEWGSNLMLLPESRNMTILSIESSPWSNTDFAIPYPTYFHPSNDIEIHTWQNRMRRLKRRHLFSFVGAPRPNLKDSIRKEIFEQCKLSLKCGLMNCNERGNKCYQPVNVMKMFQNSVFCLQPPGDSLTRRSAFDSILAGCIPVFFHPGSFYVQYIWHLPKDYTKYSIFIPMNGVKDSKLTSIERVLNRVSRKKIMAMREEVIRLIPRIIYADPRFRLEKTEDAFDVTIRGVIDKIDKFRGESEKSENERVEVSEEISWKYNLFGTVGEHEWDPFFSNYHRPHNEQTYRH